MQAHDISGNWSGHYEQDGRRHGIAMRVAHKGGSIAGSMRDEDTLLVGGLDADTARELRTWTGTSGSVAPETFVSLPADAVVEGDVEGDRVTFVKRYRGAQVTRVLVDGLEMRFELDQHRVLYRGMLDRAGSVLHGEWSIPPMEGQDPPACGRFELRRV